MINIMFCKKYDPHTVSYYYNVDTANTLTRFVKKKKSKKITILNLAQNSPV